MVGQFMKSLVELTTKVSQNHVLSLLKTWFNNFLLKKTEIKNIQKIIYIIFKIPLIMADPLRRM